MYLSGTDPISTDLYSHGISYEHPDRSDLYSCMAYDRRKLIRHKSGSGLSHAGTKRRGDSDTSFYHHLYRHCDGAGRHTDMFRDHNRNGCATCTDLHAYCVTDEREFRSHHDARMDDDEWPGIFDK